MTIKQKKALYESIMKTVAKTVKKSLQETKLNETYDLATKSINHNVAINNICDCAVRNIAIQRAGRRRYNCDVFVNYDNDLYNADIITRTYVNRGIPSFTINPERVDEKVELIGFYYIADNSNYEQNVHFVKVSDIAEALIDNKFRRVESSNIDFPIYIIHDGWILSHSLFTVDIA